MKNALKVAEQLRKIASESEPMGVVLPKNDVGLPEGTFILDSFLRYIADALDPEEKTQITGGEPTRTQGKDWHEARPPFVEVKL